jgi:hypothetical protein
VDEWTQAGEVRVYDADTLWEYINGAAELFVEYGVLTCRTADLSSGDVSVTVDLYDMASPLGALGVYRREQAGHAIEVPGAAQAALSPPYQALMVKGNTYAKVNVYEGELDEPTGLQLMENLAKALPGEGTLPPEFSLLPETGRVPGSEGYQPRSFLGLAELTDCVFAEYRGDGGSAWEGFVVLPEASSQVWEAVASEWDSMDYQGATIRYREVPYSGLVGIMMTDDGLMGVSGAADEGQMQERLSQLIG